MKIEIFEFAQKCVLGGSRVILGVKYGFYSQIWLRNWFSTINFEISKNNLLGPEVPVYAILVMKTQKFYFSQKCVLEYSRAILSVKLEFNDKFWPKKLIFITILTFSNNLYFLMLVNFPFTYTVPA